MGLALSYVLQTVDTLQWAVRQSIEVEMQFISVERIMAYTRCVFAIYLYSVEVFIG